MIAHNLATITISRVLSTKADAEALAAVEHASLGDSDYTPGELLDILMLPEQYVYLARASDEAVGFCACFETDSGRRLELDMLGVLPAWRGQGIATRLISHALEEGRARAVVAARGVVAAGNAASRHVFERAGLVARATRGTAIVHAMLVYPMRGDASQALPAGWSCAILDAAPEGARPRAPERLHLSLQGARVAGADCLAVQTLSYRGLWVEACEAAPGAAERWLARALAERAKQLALDEVGYLAPQPAEQPAQRVAPRMLSWVREGYQDLGDYLVYEVGAR